jgi:hypothetical protein
VPLAGGALDVAQLGAPLGMGDAALDAWLRDAGACVASLYGRFPVDAAVFIVPVAGRDELVFGRVLSLSGASVELFFGHDTPAAMAHDDWVAVHELFHLGAPSFVGEGRWLEEGLATYYEPVLRRRAGWTGPSEPWAEFARQMPRGVRKPDAPVSLEERDDIGSIYWGGALFVLLADVGLREATGGRASFDDVLRASLARLGDTTHVATVAQLVALADEATGTHVVSDVYARVAQRGEVVDLGALWRKLGVAPRPGGGVDLVEDAPAAAIRRAIAAGAVH